MSSAQWGYECFWEEVVGAMGSNLLLLVLSGDGVLAILGFKCLVLALIHGLSDSKLNDRSPGLCHIFLVLRGIFAHPLGGYALCCYRTGSLDILDRGGIALHWWCPLNLLFLWRHGKLGSWRGQAWGDLIHCENHCTVYAGIPLYIGGSCG